MQARHLESGVLYTIRTGLPFGGEHASGISKYCVRDGRLILLADRPDKVREHYIGHFYSRVLKADDAWAPPAEGQIFSCAGEN